MIEIFSDMPEDTFGGRISGHLTREDYTITMLPILRKIRDSGRPMRVLVVLDHFWEEPGAMLEALKADIEFGVFRRPAWERFAIVTDLAWVDKLVRLMSWLIPGEMRVFPTAELNTAKEWVAGSTQVPRDS
ncbi:MAG TPA: STAS/SEC14 domain-containing protein [Pseudonocardiaceae bacterium]|nr:STAS/SEC14 domain-containing protein [Pseudonocardiaceae bacterium]